MHIPVQAGPRVQRRVVSREEVGREAGGYEEDGMVSYEGDQDFMDM